MARRRQIVLAGLAAVVVAVVAVVVFVLGDDDGSATKGGSQDAVVVTLADNGGDVAVPPNTPFVVRLKGSAEAPWGLPEAQADTLALVGSSMEVDGSVSATFLPLEVTPGVVVSAARTGGSTDRFEVTIRVVR